MGGGDGEKELTLEKTPTWIVAVVCSIIVIISLLVERFLHLLGKYLKRKKQKSLFDALQKIKEELMLVGLISLLLAVFEDDTQRIRIPKTWNHHMLPCDNHSSSAGRRRILAAGGCSKDDCTSKDMVPLLSTKALHELHIFIFVLAVTHVIMSVSTMVLGGLKIRKWKAWEDSIHQDEAINVSDKVTLINQFRFINDHFHGIGKQFMLLHWLFYGSVTRSDYTTMRLGFIMTHCRGNVKFNFYRYMVRALEADFKKVVGISWYFWIFVVIFLMLNIHGWRTYFYVAFGPLVLLLAVGTKLAHVMTQLAKAVAEKHSAIEGDLVIKPSDNLFWFQRPRLILILIHFLLFLNSLEIALFFWIWITFGFDSCINGSVGFNIARLVIGVTVQLLCSYSTLPLYAIITQMGTSFKKVIFDEHIQEGLVGWAQQAKMRVGQRADNYQTGPSHVGPKDGTLVAVQTPEISDQGKFTVEEEANARLFRRNTSKASMP
ncbi:MLO-like protein 1 isoform X2 [Phoenix dactylifera]|uniref:MLO-like protein n=1 Tax=Phoenix dactylifera TaxID=42345 RepID=A0A8B8J932_PHODC|nr:MLO-like protein 1 isoform X2 [Phoenix dactylifera]